MECPFEMPVRKEVTHVTEAGVKYKVLAGKYVFAAFLSKNEADYIVHVINSHKKLVEALKKYGDHEPGCIKGDACNCGFEQALEAEK